MALEIGDVVYLTASAVGLLNEPPKFGRVLDLMPNGKASDGSQVFFTTVAWQDGTAQVFPSDDETAVGLTIAEPDPELDEHAGQPSSFGQLGGVVMRTWLVGAQRRALVQLDRRVGSTRPYTIVPHFAVVDL
jgi:hypothetical protein